MANQAIGLAEAVGMASIHKTASPKVPWRWLPGNLCPAVLDLGLASNSDPLSPPWPDLLICCGRRSSSLSLAIRRQSRGKTFTVQIQDPQISPRHFDMVVPMQHDGLNGDNVYPVLTALHRVTPQRLQQAREHFASKLLGIEPQQTRIAVLIGGNSRRHRLDENTCRKLAQQLLSLHHNMGAQLLVTASRRTGTANIALLKGIFAQANAYFWSGEGENPYLGILALADYILVTEDSVSMVSEACATGKPVYTIAMQGKGGGRIATFHEQLRQQGMTRPFAGELQSWHYPPCNETSRIARLVDGQLAARSV